jgi:hypothetical protein
VADAVLLGLGHQSRALSGEAMADCLQLGQLAPRRQPDIRVRKPIRPEDADGDRSADDRRLGASSGLEERRCAGNRGCDQRRRP